MLQGEETYRADLVIASLDVFCLLVNSFEVPLVSFEKALFGPLSSGLLDDVFVGLVSYPLFVALSGFKNPLLGASPVAASIMLSMASRCMRSR